MKTHFEKLIAMYNSGPINIEQKPVLTIDKGRAIIKQVVHPALFHAAKALHGSIYFKLLDDAAYFASNSLITSSFVVTSNFSIQLIRPVNKGVITAHGKVISVSRNIIIASAELYSEDEKLLAIGTGNFMKSAIPLSSDIGYQ